MVATAVTALAFAETSSAACRTTRANGRVPAGASSTLFGNGRLATAAYGEIYATARTLNRDGTISEKFPWATGITFPTAGCWRITGAVGDVRLSLVVLVRR